MKSITHLLFAGLLSAALFAGCSGDKSQGNHNHNHGGHGHEHASSGSADLQAEAPQFEVDEKFRAQLGKGFAAYAKLQEAFVKSDAGEVREEARKSAEALEKVDGAMLSGAAHHDWMTYKQGMQDALEAIQTSDDIEEQREAFSSLSDSFYKSIKAFGVSGVDAYYAYCPMAFDDQGGYWLTAKNEIRNPYFGDKMLKCGMVKEKL